MTTRKKLKLNRRVKRKGEYWLVRTIAGLARILPRAVGHRLFSAVGAMAARLLKRDWSRAVGNLGIAFPELPPLLREAMARAMFKNLGRNAFDFLNLEGASLDRLEGLVEEVVGLDIFQRVYGQGQGAIVITGHIGCWELLPAYFSAQGYPCSVVARRMKDNRLDRRLLEIRESLGVSSIDRNSNPRRMIEVLKRGELLGVLIDQHTSVAGTYVPFFGRPAFTPTAVAKLSIMTGAPILPMGVFLDESGRHVIHVLPPLSTPRGVDRETAIHELTSRCSLAVEDLIRIDPKQWVWFHHRWREPQSEGRTYAVQS